MKSRQIEEYFLLIEKQRIAFYNETQDLVKHPFERPMLDKWSVNETIYHLILMIRLVRRVSMLYLPLMLPYGKLRKSRPFPKEGYDIYKEYKNAKKRSMPAPFILIPPKNMLQKYNFNELQQMLLTETNLLKKQLSNLQENVAGQIRYPDPIAHYPNVIQSIHLIAIHEQHHYDLVLQYEREKHKGMINEV